MQVATLGKEAAVDHRPLPALVFCAYGGFNALRQEAAKRMLAALSQLDPLPREAVFLELVCPGQKPLLEKSDCPRWLDYLRLYGKKRNMNIFQKEALWNLAAKFTSSASMMFMDADAYPENCPDWLARLGAASRPGVLLHPSELLAEEKWGDDGSDLMYLSAFSPKEMRRPNGSPMYRFPGLGYCLTRTDFIRMDGFNPFAITGSGDSVFLKEVLGDQAAAFGFAFRYHNALVRPHQPKLQPMALDGVTLRHCYHGPKVERSYRYSREIVNLFGLSRALCHLDSSGLMAWNDPECWLAQIANTHKARMTTRADFLALLAETADRRLAQFEKNEIPYNQELYHHD